MYNISKKEKRTTRENIKILLDQIILVRTADRLVDFAEYLLREEKKKLKNDLKNKVVDFRAFQLLKQQAA